jgi:butyrate kinase
LSDDVCRVLTINPGSTSTKIGIYTEAGAELVRAIVHQDAELAPFRGLSALAQEEFRAAAIDALLAREGKGYLLFAAVAGRGGLLPPTVCGTYRVDEAMVEALRQARRGEHASNLGAVLALRFARRHGVGAYVVDPVTVDEWQPCARLSGSPLVPRTAVGHALNIKAVARRFARLQGRAYGDLRLIVIHMGSGITVSAHRDGRMIDNNTPEEGPFGPDRSGYLPVRELVRHCTGGRFSPVELDRQVFGEGGLYAYLGTRDLREVERRMEAGDQEAELVFASMVYQIAKEAGAMAVVLNGAVDAILLTGGMAYSERLVDRLRGYLEWIASCHIFPGEDELQALAEGVFRVLRGEEEARRLQPAGSAEAI